MSERWDHQGPHRLTGYESWAYQMPCLGSDGDAFVSITLPRIGGTPGEPPNRRVIAIGDVLARRKPAARLKTALESELVRLVDTETDPSRLLKELNHSLTDIAGETDFAMLVVAIIDGDRHEMTVANAGSMCPLLRRPDGRVEMLMEDVCGFPLWVDRKQTYETITIPVGIGDVAVFFSDGITAVIDHQERLFDLNRLRTAIAKAPDDAASVGWSILQAVRRFQSDRPQLDDITLLCLGRTA